VDEVARTIAALENRQRGRQRMGALANAMAGPRAPTTLETAVRQRWEDPNRRQAAAQRVAEMGATIVGPHLSKSFANMGELMSYAPEFIGPQADVKDLVDFSRMAGESARQGDYGTAAINAATAAATVPMMALPWSIGGMTKALNTPGPVYQSRLTKALEAMPQETMQTGQLTGYLAKYPGGVSADELQHTGVADMLNAPGKVTKTDLLNQVKANPLEIKDVVKGKLDHLSDDERQFRALDEYIREYDGAGSDTTTQWREMGERIGPEGRERALGHSEVTTKFGSPDLNLPGGEDYKEMLLTLPARSRSVDSRTPNQTAKDLFGDDVENIYDLSPEQTRVLQRELDKQYDAGEKQLAANYTAGHYDEPNVLAHARYDTRTVDGDKTLFIQEIQSDWHQAGRKKGYTTEAASETKALQAESDAIINRGTRDPRDGSLTIRPDDLARYNELQPLIEQGLPIKPNSVPDAPFKKNWHELTLKRMIREAAETGHDRIAWTPGQVQADRYDLSKKIDELMATRLDDGTVELTATLPGGGTHKFGKVPDDKLDATIGKDLGDKIREQEVGFGDVYNAEDLRVGGEGMKGFYDKMMVKAANKYAKKYGAKVEVKKTTTDAPGDVVQEAGSRQWFIERDGIMDTDRTFATEALAREAMEEGQDIWTLKITPEMKRAILTEGVQASVDQNRTGGGILANALDNVTRQRGMMA
jgi:hypothetical protein